MAGPKRERYKTEPRISVPFMLELEYESKIIKKTTGISDYRNMFLAANVPSIKPTRYHEIASRGLVPTRCYLVRTR